MKQHRETNSYFVGAILTLAIVCRYLTRPFKSRVRIVCKATLTRARESIRAGRARVRECVLTRGDFCDTRCSPTLHRAAPVIVRYQIFRREGKNDLRPVSLKWASRSVDFSLSLSLSFSLSLFLFLSLFAALTLIPLR